MSASLVPILVFFATVFAVIAVYSLCSDLYLKDRQRVQDRIDAEFRNKTRDRAIRSLIFKGNDLGQSSSVDGQRPPKPTWQQRLQTLLDQSGLELTQTQLRNYCVAASLALGTVGGIWQRSIFVGLIGLALGAYAPVFFVRLKRSMRQEALRRQLPDAFDIMGRVLRSGQSMSQAMESVAVEFGLPIAGEMAYCAEQQKLGLSPEIAYRDLARRAGIMEADIFVVAMLVQSQVGGNLAQILERLASMIRERLKLRGTVNSLTAEGRMQAIVLMALPPFLYGMMLMVNREYAITLLHYPILLWGMGICMGLGALWIRKIVNFDF
jgi:tight adherence protein B